MYTKLYRSPVKCTVIPRRFVQTYVSDRYLGSPFHIGYPATGSELRPLADEIRARVFPGKYTDHEQVYPSGDGADITGPSDESQVHRRPRSVTLGARSSRVKYTQPKPTRVTGSDLFKALNGHLFTKAYIDVLWKGLPRQRQDQYSEDGSFIERAYAERLRRWEGHEIVEYLKTNTNVTFRNNGATSTTRARELWFNPFPFSGLYPWEIIETKLRQRRVLSKMYKFEIDYYDRIIWEAFSKHHRPLLNIFYSDLRELDPDNCPKTHTQIKKRFALLSETEQKNYQRKYNRLRYHTQTNRVEGKGATQWGNYVQSRKADPVYDEGGDFKHFALTIAKDWAELSQSEKDKYSPSLAANSREHKERLLQGKVRIVMSYIYDVMGDGQFNWKKDMEEKRFMIPGGLHHPNL